MFSTLPVFFFKRLEFTQTIQVWEHYFKSFSRVKSTQDGKMRFIKRNELKLVQVDLFSFFLFKRVIIFEKKFKNINTDSEASKDEKYTNFLKFSNFTVKFKNGKITLKIFFIKNHLIKAIFP